MGRSAEPWWDRYFLLLVKNIILISAIIGFVNFVSIFYYISKKNPTFARKKFFLAIFFMVLAALEYWGTCILGIWNCSIPDVVYVTF